MTFLYNSLLFTCLMLGGCGHVRIEPDPALGSIDAGYKRVETEICGRHDVGENGCVLLDGAAIGNLKIKRILQGEILITGSGCGVDRAFQYPANEKQPWVEIPLRELVGERIQSDCVLDIYQKITFPIDKDNPVAVEGIHGSITLGTCPSGVGCAFESEQIRAKSVPSPLGFDAMIEGDYLLRGCGQEAARGSYAGALVIRIDEVWPGGYPQKGKVGCLFILGVRGTGLHKIYRKVHVYNLETLFLTQPSFVVNGGRVEFVADSAVSLTTVGEQVINHHKGRFKPSPNGDWIRFYTIRGRTQVIFLRDGRVEWTR